MNTKDRHYSFSRAVLSSFMTEEDLKTLDIKYEEMKYQRKLKRNKSIGNFCPHCGKSLTVIK